MVRLHRRPAVRGHRGHSLAGDDWERAKICWPLIRRLPALGIVGEDITGSDLEAIHTFEGTETMQTLIVGRDITGIGAFA